MKKYIDANKKVHIQVYDDEHEEYSIIEKTISECLDYYTDEGCPDSEDVEKMQHARWIIDYDEGTAECSNCNVVYEDRGDTIPDYWVYCPKCGARMDEVIPRMDEVIK